MNDRVIGSLTTAPASFTLARAGGEAKTTGDVSEGANGDVLTNLDGYRKGTDRRSAHTDNDGLGNRDRVSLAATRSSSRG